MTIFDEFNRFFEKRLDEFLRNNPQLELSILEEQLQEQEEETLKLITDLQLQEKKAQEDILSTAEEIKRWHTWVEKARQKGRLDLAQAAAEREASLLRHGNQLWGKMQGHKEYINKAKDLLRQIQTRRQEVRAKAAEVANQKTQQASTNWDFPPGWNQKYDYKMNSGADPLEEKFRKWDMDDELEDMKRRMGR